MASAAVNIPNTLEAIQTGVIPGLFNADRTVFAFHTLAYVGARGVTHFWTIRVKLLQNDSYVPITDEMLGLPSYEFDQTYKAEITVESKQKDGKIRDIIPTYVS